MRTFYKNLLLAMASVLTTSATAQVSAYIFSQPSGTYIPITGGTVVATATINSAPGNLTNLVWNLPSGTFPFPFSFNGIPYTGCNISTNGFITFGSVAPGATITNPIANTGTYDGAISAWGRSTNGVFNIGTGPFYTSEVRIEVIGTAPSRTIVIQYDNWRYGGGASASAWILDFQIRLSESTNFVSIVYGPGLMVAGSLSTGGFASQVGLRGATNADYNNRTNLATVSFTASTPGTANNVTQAFAISGGSGVGIPGMPPDGLTYVWDPGCAIHITGSGTNSLAPVICNGGSVTLTTDAVSNYTWSTGNSASTSIVVSPTTNTTYSITGTSTANCVASALINVIVSSGVPTLAVAASATQVCLGKTVTLTATGANSYSWTGGITNGVSFMPSSSNVYTVNAQNGCGSATSTATISVAPLTVSGSSSPNTICAGNASSLSVLAAANLYTWQPVNVSGSSSVIVVNPQVTTIYTVTVSDGTCSGVTNITLTANPLPTVSAVASPSAICPGESSTLTVTGGLNYTWSPVSSSSSLVVVNPTVTAAYSVIGNDSFGCLGGSSPVVVVGAQPTLVVNASNSAVCAGGSSTLMVTGASNYEWTGGPPTGTYVVTPGLSTVYNVTGTLSSSGCIDTETISIDVFDPVMTITGNTTICSGALTDFTATAPGAGPTTYLWIPGNIIFPVANGLSPAANTIYTVSALSTSLSINCPATGTVLLVVNPNPTVTAASNPTAVCRNMTSTLSASGAASFVWSNSTSTLTTASSLTLTSANASILTLSVTGTDALGCTNTQEVSLLVSACTGIEQQTETIGQLLVYPNPNNGEFIVASTFERDLVLVNGLGQVIKHLQLDAQNDLKVSVSDLASGIYFITDPNQAGLKEKIVVTK